METYDFIIAGSGCAGLSLAYYLLKEDPGEFSVLLIDKDEKNKNDRTWCYWTDRELPFQPIVKKEWFELSFFSHYGERTSDLSPLKYQLIHSSDFYRFIQDALRPHPQFHWKQGQITGMGEDDHGPFVKVDGQLFRGRYIFNSCFFPPTEKEEHVTSNYFLRQHFMGWIVETDRAAFDPEKAVLMDFRTSQAEGVSFFYVLPFSPNRALVEYTVFSENLLPAMAYEEALQQYLQNLPGFGDFRILDTEFGVIPMTNRIFPEKWSDHIINIGTAGGAVKPTTGYAFLNIQEQTSRIARQLGQKLPVSGKPYRKGRFRFYDTLLLHLLREEGSEVHRIFSNLFLRNDLRTILTFMDERSALWQEARIFGSLPVLPFLKAIRKVYFSGKNRTRSQLIPKNFYYQRQ